MPSSAWYSFRKLVESLHRDYASSFITPPGISRDDIEEMVLTVRDGFLLVARQCHNLKHVTLYPVGKSHRHGEDGQWYVRVTSADGQEGDISE